MAERTEIGFQQELREKVSRFLADDESSRRRALISMIRRIRDEKWQAVLFGGTLRDLMIYGLSKLPRDVDIVVAGPTTDELADSFRDFTSRRTRFGGLHLEFGGWMFDVWPLSETWALRHSAAGGPQDDFAALPKTTFLNVEAVAVDLAALHGKSRRIFAHGFFEALADRTLEINFEDNPFPALCVVRSLITAARLRFSIGPKLSKYLIHYGEIFSREELVQVQTSHYGSCKRTATEFDVWLRAIGDQYRAGGAGARGIKLPIADEQQLELFSDWTPAW
jgi:hypothetical protein